MMSFLSPAAFRTAQAAGRPILRFFAPQGRHVAPMGVKFDVEEGTTGPLRSPPPRQISPPSVQRQGCRPQKLKFLLRFDQNVEVNAPQGRIPCAIFTKSAEFVLHFRMH